MPVAYSRVSTSANGTHQNPSVFSFAGSLFGRGGRSFYRAAIILGAFLFIYIGFTHFEANVEQQNRNQLSPQVNPNLSHDLHPDILEEPLEPDIVAVEDTVPVEGIVNEDEILNDDLHSELEEDDKNLPQHDFVFKELSSKERDALFTDWGFHLETIENSDKITYGIVIDAGSTGTRPHLFQFFENQIREKKLQVSGGIAELGASSFQNILQQLVAAIPSRKRKSTPAVLKATAGLRQRVSDEKRRQILQDCRSMMEKFHLFVDPSESSVQVMDGVLEGVYAWATVNMLYGNLGKPANQTVGILDLGGGSTQIVSVYQVNETVPANASYVYAYGDETYHLYTTSFMDFGLQSIRKKLVFGNFSASNTAHLLSQNDPLKPIHHDCLVQNSRTKFKDWHNQEQNLFNQLPLPVDTCFNRVEQLFENEACQHDLNATIQCSPQPFGLKHSRFIAMSYFYDRANDFHMDPERNTVGKLHSKASELCAMTFEDIHQTYGSDFDSLSEETAAFACIDTIYLYQLLRRGYKMDLEKNVPIVKSINGSEVTWALGCMMDEMNRFKSLSEKN